MAAHSRLTEHDLELIGRFNDEVAPGLRELVGERHDIDVVVGITTLAEAGVPDEVRETVRAGLAAAQLAERAVILSLARHRGRHTADPVGPGSIEIELDPHFHGRGWQARAFLEVAHHAGAALVLLPASMQPQPDDADIPGAGFSPVWISRLVQPVLSNDQDVALGRLSRHPLAHPIEAHVLRPVLRSVLGADIRQPATRLLALSREMARECVQDTGPWPLEVGEYGFGLWLVMRALAGGRALCEVPLGLVHEAQASEGRKRAFRQMVHVLFGELVREERALLDRPQRTTAPPVFGADYDYAADGYAVDTAQLERRFRLEFNHYDDTLYPEILSPELRRRIESATNSDHDGVELGEEEWVELLGVFMLAYRFENRFAPDDVVDALFPFMLARYRTFARDARDLEAFLTRSRKLGRDRGRAMWRHEIERRIDLQSDRFARRWTDLRREWKRREEEHAPYLPRLGAWEFVPNVGVIVPQELEAAGEHSVWAYQVYKEIIDRYRSQYIDFASRHLGVDNPIDSASVLDRVEAFMERVESAMARDLFPRDISTVDGARSVATEVCRRFAENDSFHLTPAAAAEILGQAPPSQLITSTGARNVNGLLERMDPLSVLGAAAWTDQHQYLQRLLDIIGNRARPDWFTDSPVEVQVIDRAWLPGATEGNATAAITRLAGRVVTLNTSPQAGGAFPMLWFVLRVMKSIVGIELFSRAWRTFAAEKAGFVEPLVNSIRGHWGRRVLSAHYAFENRHQRILVERLRRIAGEMAGEDPSKREAAELLGAALDVYHLSITLPDATFVPLSAWTWASYSNRGGVGAPTPLSSLVERDWATRDFFGTYLERAGLGNQEAIDRKILELMRTGHESDDLRRHMLDVSADPDHLVVQQSPPRVPPPARKLERPRDEPLLAPTDNEWESRYVLNAAALRVDGTVYILYRAFGNDEISRIGLAWTRDGIHIDGRLADPIFAPGNATETAGVEDPRTIIIGDQIYMLYTAWDHKVAQIAMASIPVEAFLERRFDRWQRRGLAYPGLANKDAILYPEKVKGKYVVYHRIDPNMWVSYIDDLSCPWPREGQQIFAGPRAGMMWDGVKIGAGGPPIKTTHGWLNIYHGVDYERSYRLGTLLMALDDPARVLYRSPNPILEPETDYELGGAGSWVPHVVFTCGAVPAKDTEIVGPDDEILVYYGAADTVIGVAKGKLRDMVPVIDDL